MLVSFSVKNYKSFYEEATLDMRIDVDDSNREEIENNPFVCRINDEYISKLCIIYGHNGSGKSNLLEFMSILLSLHLENDNSKIYELLSTPNMIYGKNEDTEFYLEFYNDNILFKYGIILDSKSIKYEIFKENDLVIFERKNNILINSIDNLKDIKGIPNQSTVFHYCNRVEIYKSYLYRYFLVYKSVFLNYIYSDIPEALFFDIDNIYNLLTRNHIWSIYKELIKLADVGISDIKVIKQNIKTNDFIKQFLKKENEYELISIHDSYENKFKKIESGGTKTYANKLIAVLSSIGNGNICLLDEFNGVQSELVEFVINLYKKGMFEDLKKDSSQLILTTHDTNLMSMRSTLLNHYWFLNKENNKSELYCASDFEDLEKKDLEKEYKLNNLKAKYNSQLFNLPTKFFIESSDNSDKS